jgi:hypothetical protein
VRNKNELQSKLNEAYRNTLTLDFNPLNFVKWSENKISEILIFLLDPQSTHDRELSVSTSYDDFKRVIGIENKFYS